MIKVKLVKSPNAKKKFRAIIDGKKSVDFGAKGYSDYTIHGDQQRMKRYLARHGRGKETWTKNGLTTAGFWSRWLLWSEPSMNGAKKLMTRKFGIKFV